MVEANYDASEGVELDDEGCVSEWRDMSGNGRHITFPPGRRPRVLAFDPRTDAEREMDREVRRRVRMYMSQVSCRYELALGTWFAHWPAHKFSTTGQTMREALHKMRLAIAETFDHVLVRPQ